MKINRHGRAKILTQSEIQLVFSHGLNSEVPVKAIAGGLITLLGMGMLIGQNFKPEPQATKAINQTRIEKWVKYR